MKLPVLLFAYCSATHELRLPVNLLIGRPPGEELPKQVRKALKFTGDVTKRWHNMRAEEIDFKRGDAVWLHKPQQKRGQSDVTYWIRESMSPRGLSTPAGVRLQGLGPTVKAVVFLLE